MQTGQHYQLSLLTLETLLKKVKRENSKLLKAELGLRLQGEFSNGKGLLDNEGERFQTAMLAAGPASGGQEADQAHRPAGQ